VRGPVPVPFSPPLERAPAIRWTCTTRKAEGPGLGLTLTERFVELHDGSIRVESELGKGSTFTFTLAEQA